MIYLGRDSFYDEEKNQHYFILKIGYTADENKDQRLLNYTSHNPSFKFISIILGGSEEHEKKIHYKFKEYRISGREWFEYRDEILDFFKTSTLEDVDKISLPEKQIPKLEFRYPKIEIQESWDLKVQEFFRCWNLMKKVYVDRIRYMCEFLIQFPETTEYILMNLKEPDKIRQHILTLGPERIMSLGYNLTQINQAMGIVIFDRELLAKRIYSRFHLGDRYSKANLKAILGNIYEEVGYKATPKASDLENWFEIKRINILNSITGKRDNGFEIISIKE